MKNAMGATLRNMAVPNIAYTMPEGASVPPLGFENERWFGKGLYECKPLPGITVFVEFRGDKPFVLAHLPPLNINGKAQVAKQTSDLFEAKMLIQSIINEHTSGGN